MTARLLALAGLLLAAAPSLAQYPVCGHGTPSYSHGYYPEYYIPKFIFRYVESDGTVRLTQDQIDQIAAQTSDQVIAKIRALGNGDAPPPAAPPAQGAPAAKGALVPAPKPPAIPPAATGPKTLEQVLTASCTKCHSAELHKGNLVLMGADGKIPAGVDILAVYERMITHDEHDRMPPAPAPRVSKADAEVVKRFIYGK